MKIVSGFEAKLLRCTRAALQFRPNPDQARGFAKSTLTIPGCLAADAVHLLKDTLAKGTTLLLAREGWRKERHLRNGQPRFGRLWERTSPAELGLTFSAHSLEFLCWVTANNPAEPAPEFSGSCTVGDLLLAFRCYRLLRDTPQQKPLRAAAIVRNNALCRLFFPDEITAASAEPIDWNAWTEGPGGAILEALDHPLADTWLKIENAKQQQTDPGQMNAIAAGQEIALSGWLDALEKRQRWDLARFLLRIGSKLWLAENVNAQRWTGSLILKGTTLAERTNLFRAALVLLRHWQRLAEWTRQARAVGYLDENYAAAQLWKADWEFYQGDETARRAQDILREIEPLKPGSTT